MLPSWWILFIILLDLVIADALNKAGHVIKRHKKKIGSRTDARKEDEKSNLNGVAGYEDADKDGQYEQDEYDESAATGEDPDPQDDSGEDENDDYYDGDNAAAAEAAGEQGDHIEYTTRALQAGDTFTPLEMLPVAFKLIQKVENVGEGRGIVSSAKSAQDLADRLFGAFFLTTKRIVYLSEKDMSGLDALQALAFEGEAVRNRSAIDSITESPLRTLNIRGQVIGFDDRPKTCHYKLINKKVKRTSSSNKVSPSRRDKILKIEKYMRLNRHLVVNAGRKPKRRERSKIKSELLENNGTISRRKAHKAHRKGSKHSKSNKKQKRKKRHKKDSKTRGKKSKSKKSRHRKKGIQRRQNNGPRPKRRRNQNNTINQVTTTSKPNCMWRYNCRDPNDLDTCRLHTSCLNDNDPKAVIDDIFVDHNEDEHKVSVQKFRKMLGITLIDEDVEKIIEHHVLQVKPENMKGIPKIESLDEYFNNIIMAQHAQSTTPIVNIDEVLIPEDEQWKAPSIEIHKHQSNEEVNTGLRNKEKNKKIKDTAQQNGRNILGLPRITTPKSRMK